MTIALDVNARTAVKATIRRASARARQEMNDLDRKALDQLSGIYRQAAADIQDEIRNMAGADGNLRLDVLRGLLGQVNGRLSQIEQARNDLFGAELLAAAQLGAQPFSGQVASDLVRIANEAVQFVHTFIAEDGLQLSDRVWRVDRHARDVVGQAIESAVIQGHSASRAAQDFLSRGQPVPADIAEKMGLANAGRVARVAGDALMTGEGTPYDNALRLFRTELNRAHGETYRAAGFDHPDVIGTRFLLSPNHPKTDICDMHASVNRYGLGPGVYPKGKSPWPAHPNTLSYEEVVFTDEVTAADRSGKETPIDWLKRQPPGAQIDILGGIKKAQALRQDLLRANEIGAPWRILKQRYAQRGIEIEDVPRENVATPAPAPPAGAEAPGLNVFRPFDSIDAAVRWANQRGTALLPGTAGLDAINSGLLGITRVLDPFRIANTEIAFNRRLPAHVNAQAGTSYDGSVRHIRFAPGRNKTVKEAVQRAGQAHQTFLSQRDANIARLEPLIVDPVRSEQARHHLQRQIEIARAAKRWSISSDPTIADPIVSTASHEAGHTLYYTKRLDESWALALSRNKVEAVDIVRVSQYSATSRSELWAEVTAAIHSGLRDDIPRNVFRAYQEMIDAIEPVP